VGVDLGMAGERVQEHALEGRRECLDGQVGVGRGAQRVVVPSLDVERQPGGCDRGLGPGQQLK
jgi:hypothetical protein